MTTTIPAVPGPPTGEAGRLALTRPSGRIRAAVDTPLPSTCVPVTAAALPV